MLLYLLNIPEHSVQNETPVLFKFYQKETLTQVFRVNFTSFL